MRSHRNASGHLVFDRTADAEDYEVLVNRAVRRFALEPIGERVVGLEQVFQDFRKGDLVVGLDWDIWWMFTVSARSSEAEPLALEIARFLAP